MLRLPEEFSYYSVLRGELQVGESPWTVSFLIEEPTFPVTADTYSGYIRNSRPYQMKSEINPSHDQLEGRDVHHKQESLIALYPCEREGLSIPSSLDREQAASRLQTTSTSVIRNTSDPLHPTTDKSPNDLPRVLRRYGLAFLLPFL